MRRSFLDSESQRQLEGRNAMLYAQTGSYEERRSPLKRAQRKNLEIDSQSSKPSQIETLPSISAKNITQRMKQEDKKELMNLLATNIDNNPSRAQPLGEQTASLSNRPPKKDFTVRMMNKPILSEKIVDNEKLNSEEDQPECEAEVVYSSLSSERYSDNFAEGKQQLAHPRNTSKYLEQQKEQSKLNTPRSSNNPDTENKEASEIEQIKLIDRIAGYIEPLPLLPQGKYFDPDCQWRRKRLKQNFAPKRARSHDSNESQTKRDKEKRRKIEQYIKELQEKLNSCAEEIVVTTDLNINLEKYPQFFKYKIYECFKPKTLKQTRNYIDFLTKDDTQAPLNPDELSPELQQYLMDAQTDTQIPHFINEQKLLQFDSNFESGNLDSVYLVNQWEYNLMLKVDTNTRGNTYWFYFKVLNWRPDTTVTFNILNIGRDLSAFYSRGMQILSRVESLDGKTQSEWEAGEYTTVQDFSTCELTRTQKKEKDEVTKYYNKLRFQVKFPEARRFQAKKQEIKTAALQLTSELSLIPEGQESPGRGDNSRSLNNSQLNEDFPEPQAQEVTELQGSVFCFAYALPYTYGELLDDLDKTRRHLLSIGGILKDQPRDANTTVQISQEPQTKRTGNGLLRTPRQRESSATAAAYLDESERKKLTKIELAQREIKNKAISAVKDQLNRFETKLLSDEDYVKKQQQQQKRSSLIEITTDYLYYRQEVVSQSVGGLDVFQLTLTKRRGISSQNKKCMYITARLHAAETHGSWIMKYLIEELTQNPEKYENVLNNYVIKLVPMTNPDGVTIGNARSSLVGLDLNRRWSDPNATIHPEIYFVKEAMADQAATSQGIAIFCDLHGHNKKDNCFFYGCNKAADEGMLSWTKTRLLPKIFAQLEEIFDYKQCSFKQDKYKLNTARVVVWNEMKVTNSFTLETSQFAKSLDIQDIYGNDVSVKSIQLTPKDLKKIAQSFLSAVSQYNSLEKQLEQEFKLHKGWFKPQKLKEVTGEAARDKYARQMVQKEQQSAQVRKQVTKKSSNQANQPYQKVKKLASSRNIAAEETPIQRKITKISTTGLTNELSQSLVRKNTKDLRSVFQDTDKKITEKSDAGGDDDSRVRKITKIPPRKPKASKTSIATLDKSFLSQTEQKPRNITVNKWTDLFDFDEIRSGFEHIKRTKVAPPLEKLIEEESSDSCPSVDNFNDKELASCFKAVIEKDEKNPFAKSEIDQPKKSDSYDSGAEASYHEQESVKKPESKLAKSVEIRKTPQHAAVYPNEAQVEDQASLSDGSVDSGAVRQNIEAHSQAYLVDARVNPMQPAILKSRPITNRIGFLAAQLQEIDRIRLNLADHQNSSNLTNMILQQNATRIQASAGPPSGINSMSQNRSEPFTGVNSFHNRNDFVTPFLMQQNYRGPSIQQLCSQAYQNQLNTTPQVRQTSSNQSPQIICTGTAKFKFNIFQNVPPIQVTNIKKPIEAIKGMSLHPRSTQNQNQSQPPPKLASKVRDTADSSKDASRSAQRTKQRVSANRVTSLDQTVQQRPEIQVENSRQEFQRQFPQTVTNKQEPMITRIQDQANLTAQKPSMSESLNNKYHSPNIKSFDGFKASVSQSPPIFQNQKLQELTQQQIRDNAKRKFNLNLSSMDTKTAKDLSPLISALANISEGQYTSEKHSVSGAKNQIIQNKLQESHFMTQQPSHIIGMLSSNVVSPRKHITSATVSPTDSQIEDEKGRAVNIMYRRTTNTNVRPTKSMAPFQGSADETPEKSITDEYGRRMQDGTAVSFQTSSVAFRGPLRKDFVQKVSSATEQQFSGNKRSHVRRVSKQGSQLNQTTTNFHSELAEGEPSAHLVTRTHETPSKKQGNQI